jgi:LysR family transcriptional regulator, benzoate and cis,cis-muconate-responsive activator of ben and cat genes
VPDITREFRIANPDVRVELTYMTNPAQRDKILQDDIDFGFIEGSFQSSEIESVPVARHRLVTLLSPNHPLAVKDALTIEELAGEQLVMGTKVEWPILRRIVVDIFQRAGQVMSVGHEGSSLTAILGLATAGVGITSSAACRDLRRECDRRAADHHRSAGRRRNPPGVAAHQH